MTAVATRAPAPGQGSGSPTPPARDGDPTLAPTAALALVTAVVAAGMARLFTNGSFLPPILSAVVVAHATAWFGRRRRWSLPISLAVTAVVGWFVIAWEMVPASTTYGLPLGRSLDAVGAALGKAYGAFGEAVAPTPPTKGFVIAAMAGVITTAALADWSAFRIRSLFEPVIPSFTMFLFVALLGADRYRGVAAAGYLAAVLVFLFVQQVAMSTETASWFASRSASGSAAVAKSGAVLAAVTIAAALLIGPNLPGSHQPPVLNYRHKAIGNARTRQEASPLADIRGRLVNQSGIELFTVKASAPSYWRLTSLDTFDGTLWRQDFSYDAVKHRLPGGLPAALKTTEVTQQFSIENLSSIWLPAAYRPTRIDGGDAMFDSDSGSLITSSDTADGTQYSVVSEVPHITTGDFARPAPLSPVDQQRYLALPPISPRVAALARQIVRDAGARTPYQQALALQNYFQRNFRYDLSVRIPGDSGHDEKVLERFLFDIKRGYCEQFAGAYGVLARSIGLPARVAVGFTEGELGADGLYHVLGLHAHAWPEVYIDGTGWTYFEPTPGRGAPDTSQYTGVPEQQASPAPGGGGATTTTVTTTAPQQPTVSTAPPTKKELDAGGGTKTTTHRPGIWSNRVVRIAVAVAALAVLWLALVPLLLALRRHRRRTRSPEPADQVLVAWTEVGERLAGRGLGRRPAETPAEYARRVPAGIALGEEATAALGALADDVSVASWAGTAVEDDVAERAWSAATTIDDAVRAETAILARARHALDPRPLVPHRVRQLVTARAAGRRE